MPGKTAVDIKPALGLFSEPSYIGVGDKYQDRKDVPLSRHGGRQFVTNPPKKGKTVDAFFTKEFPSIAVGDTYVDQIIADRRYENSKKKGNITEQPFRPTNPPKRATGLGSLWGTIDKWPEHKGEPPADQKERRDLSELKRSIYTSPSRRGGFGFPNVGLSKDPEYVASPYDAMRLLAKKEKEREKDVRPFKSMASPGGLFNPEVWKIPEGMGKRDIKTAPARKIEKPFVPSSPGKKAVGSYGGTLNKFPEHMPAPYVEQHMIEKAGRKSIKGPAFLPGSTPKSRPTRSVAMMMVDVRPRTVNSYTKPSSRTL